MTRPTSITWCSLMLAGAMVVAAAPTAAPAQVPDSRPELITPRAEQAIGAALAYLARTQSRDGSWRTGSYSGSYPCAMTSLAGLSLMAAGNTPVEGKYAPNVRKAVDYVLSCADGQSGLIARAGEEQRPMYGHGFAMLFLAEAYGMERDVRRQQRIRTVLEAAIKLTGRSQSPAGGWYYGPDSNSDEGSVTVTQIQGLRACRNAGIMVPKQVIDNACKYIENSANPDGGIRYMVRQQGNSLPAITAAAVAVMYNAGEYENPVARGALKFIQDLMTKSGPARAFGGHKFYSLLYASQAMYLTGEDNWSGFFPAVRDDLVATQSPDGSWAGDGVGATYGTAIGLLILQLPYRYLPILQR